MAINGTDLVDNPFDTIFDCFTDLFGNGFFLIPLTFIAVALYMKTRNPVLVSAFIWGSGLLLASGNMFMNYPEMALVYGLFTAIGIVGVILGLVFNRK